MDWKGSSLRKKVEFGDFVFNSEVDKKILTESEVEYYINMLRYNAK